VYIEASSMELQCSEIKSADDNNDANECSYDDGTSTGMFTVSGAILCAVSCLYNLCDIFFSFVDLVLLQRRLYVLLCSVVYSECY